MLKSINLEIKIPDIVFSNLIEVKLIYEFLYFCGSQVIDHPSKVIVRLKSFGKQIATPFKVGA